MWPRFGIKIGNSTLCIASVKSDGNFEVIVNKQGDRISQACLLAECNEIECGLTAKQKTLSKPASCVTNNLRIFLSSKNAKEETNKYITCSYNSEAGEYELVSKSNDSDKNIVTKITPKDVCIHLFKAEYELARQSCVDDNPLVVLSIPNHYRHEATENLASAAEEAGFHVAQVISETTAAVMAYGIGESQEPDFGRKIVLCIKSGGIYSHFAFYEIIDGFYSLLKDVGPLPIGGDQYTEVVVEFITKEFYKKYRLDPKESRRSIAKIQTAATNCKHILTTLPSTQISIESLMDGIDFTMQMSRARFESLIQPVITKFLGTLNNAVEELMTEDISLNKIDEIVLLGATMKIPKLQSAVSSRFPDAVIHSSFPADEVVAIGCARQATYLIDPERQDLGDKELCYFLPTDLRIWHRNATDNASLILKKGSVLPRTVILEIKQDIDGEHDNEEETEIFHIASGDSVGDINLKVEPSSGGIFKVEAIVDVNKDRLTPSVTVKCV